MPALTQAQLVHEAKYHVVSYAGDPPAPHCKTENLKYEDVDMPMPWLEFKDPNNQLKVFPADVSTRYDFYALNDASVPALPLCAEGGRRLRTRRRQKQRKQRRQRTTRK